MKYFTIPVSLIDVLRGNLKGKEFTTDSVLKFAKSYEVGEWHAAILDLIDDQAFVLAESRRSGDVYRLNAYHPFVLCLKEGAA